MRLFAAIPLEEHILDALTDLQDDLREAGAAGNFTARENLHLTLAFIGEYSDPAHVLAVMEEARFRPFALRLSGVGHFHDLFFAGVEETPALSAYVRRLRRALAANDIPYDKKRFVPHITLIRRARSVHGGALPVFMPPEGEMTVTRIVLMRSDRGRHGMIYSEMGEIC